MPENIGELRQRVIEQMQQVLDAREPALERVPGLLGKDNTPGSATVPGMPQFCYVRVGSDEAQAIAFNDQTSHRKGLPVIVGKDTSRPNLFQVLATRPAYGDDAPVPGSASASHHGTHEWGVSEGEDIVYLRPRQIVDCRVSSTDPAGLSVDVADGVHIIGETIDYYGGGTLDITSSVPASQMRWVLIEMTPSGPSAVNGAQKGSVDLTDIPAATDPTYWRLAAILLRSTTTAITDWPDDIMILDLRFAGTRRYKRLLSGNQDEVAGALPVLTLSQADIDYVLMKITATAEAASADRTLVADSDFGTPGALVGWIQVEIDDQGDRISDGDYYIPLYAAPT